VVAGLLALIAVGLAASAGVRATEAVVPLFSLVGGLTLMTVLSSRGGPRIPF
jgi:hypothetical protein